MNEQAQRKMLLLFEHRCDGREPLIVSVSTASLGTTGQF